MAEPKKILIAEDSAVISQLIKFRLEKEGYRVLIAADGEAAMETTKAQKPDVIVLDLMMPKKDGFAFLQEMKALPDLAAIPVIMLSARILKEDAEKARSLGAYAYLTKPFVATALLGQIQKALQPRAGGS